MIADSSKEKGLRPIDTFVLSCSNRKGTHLQWASRDSSRPHPKRINQSILTQRRDQAWKGLHNFDDSARAHNCPLSTTDVSQPIKCSTTSVIVRHFSVFEPKRVFTSQGYIGERFPRQRLRRKSTYRIRNGTAKTRKKARQIYLIFIQTSLRQQLSKRLFTSAQETLHDSNGIVNQFLADLGVKFDNSRG